MSDWEAANAWAFILMFMLATCVGAAIFAGCCYRCINLKSSECKSRECSWPPLREKSRNVYDEAGRAL